MLMLLGVPIGVVFLAVWENVVSTSAMLDEDDRVRGWESVLRELPATLFLLAVVGTGLVLAARAGRLGAPAAAARAIWWHGAALLLVLVIVLNGAAEDVMTTRPATVKWLLFPVALGLTALAVTSARRAAGLPGLPGRSRRPATPAGLSG